MVGHGGSSAGSYLADRTSLIPSHCASIVATSTVRVNMRLIEPKKTHIALAPTCTLAPPAHAPTLALAPTALAPTLALEYALAFALALRLHQST